MELRYVLTNSTIGSLQLGNIRSQIVGPLKKVLVTVCCIISEVQTMQVFMYSEMLTNPHDLFSFRFLISARVSDVCFQCRSKHGCPTEDLAVVGHGKFLCCDFHVV
jgi:hypothetical protein